jgi:hypothetical protein
MFELCCVSQPIDSVSVHTYCSEVISSHKTMRRDIHLHNRKKMYTNLLFYFRGLVALFLGLGAGYGMIYYGVIEYEILFTTTNIAISLLVLYNQHHFQDTVMTKKQWQINMGLVEGYDMKQSKTYIIENIHETFKNWIITRRKVGLPIVSGSVQSETMIYPYNENAIQEPSAVLKGELSPKFDKHRLDSEVLDTIQSLATCLLLAHGQTRVYYSYRNMQYTVDRKDIDQPTSVIAVKE